MKSINKRRKSRINKSHKPKRTHNHGSSRKLSSRKRSTIHRRTQKSSTRKHGSVRRKYKGGCMGTAWNGGDVGKWPGVAGPHDGSYLPYKGTPSGLYDPPMPSNKQFQSGGKGMFSLIPQDLVNFGRSLTGGLEGVYDSYKGEPRFDSTFPLPIDQPSMNREIQSPIKYKPLNLDKIHINSGNSVSNI